MKISQILNNNVALVNRGGNEVVVYSKGIAFKKKVGQVITENEIEKTYVLDSTDRLEHFSYLLSNADARVIAMVNEVVSYGEQLLDEKANDYLYLTLLDHMIFALKRAEKEQFIRSPLTWEVKKFYPTHYQIGLFMLTKAKEIFGVEFPEDEAVSIALHFMNLQETMNGLDQKIEDMETLRNILNIIQYHFKLTLKESSMNYMRLVTHLQYFIERLHRKSAYQENDAELFNQIKGLYPDSFDCVQKINVYVENKFAVSLTQDEQTYLMLHIHRVTQRSQA
ncbi:MAG: PRD domain-containing protein [Lactobacillales bacterium]|nr:PRD domain-containing protein [Lactobacillales bacterium]